MWKNYLKISIRSMLRYKSYSFINIAGLAIGLACFILVLFYVRYEFNYEAHHKNAEHIYRVNVIQQHSGGQYKLSSSMVPLGPALKEALPEIEDYARFYNTGKSLVAYNDTKFYEDNIIFTDQGLFNLFTIDFIKGDKQTALSKKFSVVITQSTAHKYFGNENPIGKTLVLDNELQATVTAVIKDFPKNTQIKAEFLLSMNTFSEFFSEEFMNNWVSTRLQTFILVNEKTDPELLQKKVNDVLVTNSSVQIKKSLELESFARIHLHSDVSRNGDITTLYIFLGIGILVLLIACINFMNLATARSTGRANEVGLRKVIGARRFQLIKQFLGEGIITTFIALILALLLVEFFLPSFMQLTDQTLIFPPFTDLGFYASLFAITIIVGIISGSYPAAYLAAFPPVSVLKNSSGPHRGAGRFRKTLVIVQFTIAIALIICTLIVNKQLRYMRSKNLGFQKEQIVVIPNSNSELHEKIEALKQEFLSQSGVRAVTASMLLPSRIGFYNNVTWEGALNDETISIRQNKVDYDFLDTYEIKLKEGRNFSTEYPSDVMNYENPQNSGSLIINEEAARRFGWKDAIGKKIIQVYGNERSYFTVVGVVNDFHFSSLRNAVQPMCLYLNPHQTNYISIKIKPEETQSTIAHIKNTWESFNPEYPFNYSFLDESFARMYQSEEKLQTLFSYFSLLSILISCLGLFGLAAFVTEQRTKEIGVRKVLGATVSNIISLLSKEFTKWVLLANIIAWPTAWFIMKSWLDSFAYKTSLGFFIFIISGISALVIAVLTVGYQSFRAATASPVNSLKYE